MKTLLHLILFFLCVLALSNTNVNAQTTLYVNGDGICGGNTPCYTTIQDALDAASAGDTIEVASGTYNVSGSVTISKNIHLFGANYGVNGHSISRSTPTTLGYSGGIYFVIESGNNAEIDGFDYSGVNFIQCSGDSLYVRNCSFTWTSVFGDNDIYLTDAFQYFVFQNNNVILTGDVGAALQPVGNYAGSGMASKVLIDGNYIENTGMPTYSEPINLSSCQGMVSNNTIVAVENGVLLANYCGNLTITGNDFEGISDGYDSDYLSGIKLYYSPLSGPLTITNNFFDYCDYNVNTSGSPDFSANTVDIHQNSFTNTGFYALRNAGTGTFSANCNWYGASDSGTVESSVTGTITYLPWLVDGTDGDTGTPGFQPQTACLAPCALALSTASTLVTCPSANNGTASVSVTSGGTGTYTYIWSSGGQTTSTATGLDTGSYTVVLIDLNGCTATDSATVTENPLPTASVSGSGTVCAGTTAPSVSIALTGSQPWTLTYAIDDTDQTPVTGITSSPYVITNPAAGIYTASALTDANCTATSLTGSATVTINPLPTATVSGGGTICTGGTLPDVSIALTGTAPWDFTYSINGINQTPITGITSSPYIISGAGEGLYTVVALSDANCTGNTSHTGSAAVVINPYPTPTATPSSAAFCSGGRAAIILTSNLSGTTWNYSPAISGGTVTGAAEHASNSISEALTNTGTTPALVVFTIVATRSNCSTTIYDTVTVNPKPTGTVSPTSDAICSASRTGITLTAGAVSGTTFTWTYSTAGSITGTPANCTSGCGTSINDSVYNNGDVNGNVTYSITPGANGCSGSVLRELVTIRPVPAVATSTSIYDYTICNKAKTNISLTGSVPGTIFSCVGNEASPPTGGHVTGFNTVSQPVSKISETLYNNGSTPGTVVYTVSSSYLSCSGASIDISVNVNPVPTGYATTVTDTILPGDATNIMLGSSWVDNTNFAWAYKANPYITGSYICSDTGSSPGCGTTITNTLSNSGSSNQTELYTITPWANGCSGTTFTHSVLVRPVPRSNYANFVICNGGKTRILLQSIPVGSTFSYTASAINPSGGVITGFSDGTTSTIAQTLLNSGTSKGSVVYTITPNYLGSVGATIHDTVTVNPVATGYSTPSSVAMCSGSSTGITLTAGPVTGTEFTWTSPRVNAISGNTNCTGVGTCGFSINDNLTNTTLAGPIEVYTITPWANGCGGTKFTESVLVQTGNPLKPSIYGPATAICPSPVSYTYNVTNIASYNSVNWSLPSGCTIASGYTLHSNPIMISYPSGYVADTVKASATNLCDNTSANGIIKTSTKGNSCRIPALTVPAQSSEMYIVAYPNPAHDKLNVEFNSVAKGTYIIKMIDISGRLIVNRITEVEQGENHFELDLNNLAKGMYMLSVSSGEESKQAKIIVE